MVKKKLVEIIIIVHFLFCRHFVPALCARKEKQTHWIKYFKWISKRFVLIVLLYFVKRIIKKKIQSFTSVLWSNGCKTCTDSGSRAKKHTLIHPAKFVAFVQPIYAATIKRLFKFLSIWKWMWFVLQNQDTIVAEMAFVRVKLWIYKAD